VQAIAAVATAIRTQRWQTVWERVTFSSPGEIPGRLSDWTANDFLLPLEADIFGERIRFGFGRAAIHFDIESVVANQDDPTQQLLTIVPHGVSQAIVDVDGLEPVQSPPADNAGGGAGREAQKD
jgi:hypothetical protein